MNSDYTYYDNNNNNTDNNWNEYLRSVGALDGVQQGDAGLSSSQHHHQHQYAEIPDDNEMSKRMARRNDILEETVYHRCVHPHGGIADTSRNILDMLYDRQVYGGSMKVTLQQKRFATQYNDRTCRPSDGSTSSPRLKDGERSPSTVFESPVSTTQMQIDDTAMQQQHHQQQRSISRTNPITSGPGGTAADSTGSSFGESNDYRSENNDTAPGTMSNPLDMMITSSLSQDTMMESTVSTPPPPPALLIPITSSVATATTNLPTASSIPGGGAGNKYRRVTYPLRISNEIRMFGEYSLATKYHSSFLNHLGGNDVIDDQGNRPVSSNAVSTISVAFSHDGHTMASTHGDHTVKITCCETGRLLQSLDGHPRTPWTVKYHPINGNIVASGCLGHQVRVWNWSTKTCIQMVRLEFAIISLSFHPTGKLLAIANGTRLHFWGVAVNDNDNQATTSSSNATIEATTPSGTATVVSEASSMTSNRGRYVTGSSGRQGELSSPPSRPSPSSSNVNANNSNVNRTVLTELDQKHMLRCVHFPPGGTTLIIGGVNPTTTPPDVRRRGAGNSYIGGAGGMSFYLRMWDFDLEKALDLPSSPSNASSSSLSSSSSTSNSSSTRQDSSQNNSLSIHVNNNMSRMGGGVGVGADTGPYSINSIAMSIARRAISNPRTFVPRALLYNDGGFDVSSDGKTLCACAEYWLPDNVNNANELLHREEIAYDEQERRKEDAELLRLINEESLSAAAAATASNDDGGLSNTAATTTNMDAGAASDSTSPEAHHAVVSAALAKLRGSSSTNNCYARLNTSNNQSGSNSRYPNSSISSQGRSFSFRDGMEHPLAPGTPAGSNHNFSYHRSNTNNQSIAPRTPAATSPEPGSSFIPLTPPITVDYRSRNLSPPPPPGSQLVYGRHPSRRQTVSTVGMEPLPPPSSDNVSLTRGICSPPPPPPPPPSAPGVTIRPPHPLSFISTSATPGSSPLSSSYKSNQHDGNNSFRSGRYVPHVVVISLDTDPFPESLDIRLGRGMAYGAVAKGYRPRLGQLLEACPLDVNKASAVTCVKFSPSTDFCLIGYGVREPATDSGTNNNNNNNANFHPVTAIYRIRGGMTHVSTMLSGDDDVNIARFHPDSGHSFVYGTKQGRVRVLSNRPWNFYDL